MPWEAYRSWSAGLILPKHQMKCHPDIEFGGWGSMFGVFNIFFLDFILVSACPIRIDPYPLGVGSLDKLFSCCCFLQRPHLLNAQTQAYIIC